jgi:hypothetical protein
VRLRKQSLVDFYDALKEYAEGMGIGIEDAGVRCAGELCMACLELTPPLAEGGGKGLSLAAKQAGYGAVERDIRRLFVAKDERKATAVGVALNKLRAAVKANDAGKFERIRQQATLRKTTLINTVTMRIVNDGDPARAFAKAKNFFNKSNPVVTIDNQEITTDLRAEHIKRRHVTAQGKMRVWRHTGSYLGKYVAQSKATLDAYIKLTQSHVGFIKSGWWQVLAQLPKVQGKNVFKSSEVPAWVRRHSGTGYFTMMKQRGGVYLRIGNSIGDNDSQATKNNVPRVAENLADLRMTRQLEQYQKRKADDFNSGK